MPAITLTDGSVKHFDDPVTIADVAAAIGPGLAKAALAGVIEGKQFDTSHLIESDCHLAIVTSNDVAGLEIIRHSCAHLLAQAVKELYPEAQVTIGPVIDNGFYYDFVYPPGFNDKDLEAIEARMQALVKEDHIIQRQEMIREDAIRFFEAMGEVYKAEIIRDIPVNESLSLYDQGNFIDLCRGPHVPSTGHIKAFKLTKVAGAYWRGDANNVMLQRIYGTAWADKKQLKAYLTMLEEAERRDHRKTMTKMHLGHISELAPGMIFWHENGWIIYREIQQYLSEKFDQAGYQQVSTPQLVDTSLWKASGHLEKFGDNMFTVETANREYAIKPMNCPCHVQIYNHGKRSYRELPLRLAEFGSCHRNEASGALHGLMRVRNFVQDDGHIFCTEEQIHDEIVAFISQLQTIYQDFGFHDIEVKLSTRPEQRVGSDEIWDRSEAVLTDILNELELPWELLPGEGAFYGPKVEFSLRDCIGRVWQCGTVQLDFSMPERLKAAYVTEQGDEAVPVMIHRATVGSLERFIGILLENYADRLPLWLAPKQVIVLNITDKHAKYAAELTDLLKKHGIRAHKDLRNEKISYKIRRYSIEHVPYMVIVGDNEVSNSTLSVRSQSGEQQEGVLIDDFVSQLKREIDEKIIGGG